LANSHGAVTEAIFRRYSSSSITVTSSSSDFFFGRFFTGLVAGAFAAGGRAVTWTGGGVERGAVTTGAGVGAAATAVGAGVVVRAGRVAITTLPLRGRNTCACALALATHTAIATTIQRTTRS
jgi:hypothetical protein